MFSRKEGWKPRFGWAMWGSREADEQKYVDSKFKLLENKLVVLAEHVEALTIVNKREYVFIKPEGDLNYNYHDSKYITPKEARKIAKEKGYVYVMPFPKSGELWIKEETKEKKND
jgi:hypothetical protein